MWGGDEGDGRPPPHLPDLFELLGRERESELVRVQRGKDKESPGRLLDSCGGRLVSLLRAQGEVSSRPKPPRPSLLPIHRRRAAPLIWYALSSSLRVPLRFDLWFSSCLWGWGRQCGCCSCVSSDFSPRTWGKKGVVAVVPDL